MRALSFLVCESARVAQDGTFDISNGGLTELALPEFPARLALACALALEFDPAESGPYIVEISLRDPDARRLAAWRHSFAPEPRQRGAHLALNLRDIGIPAPGAYLFELRVNGKPLGVHQQLTVRAA